MHALIITDNLRISKYIRRGILCENLTSDTVLNDSPVNYENMLNYDGVFMYVENIESAMVVCEQIASIRPDMPFVLLSDKYSRELETTIKNPIIDSISVRPFNYRKIVSDMKMAIFTKKEGNEDYSYVLRDLELDVKTHQVKFNNRDVRLRNKEFALLHFFMMNIGIVLSRSTILEGVWDRNASIFTNTVDVHISALRRKIGQYSNEKYIHTIPCTGYIFA